MSNTSSLAASLAAVRERIAATEARFGRPAGAVRLLAVSKTQPAASIRAAFACGQREFGENYVQEALDKQAELADLPLVWHFIGPIQSNKTKSIAEHFDWVHSIDREKVAERLNAQRPESLPPLNVCLQVNVSGEASKSGATPEATAALAHRLATLPRLRLRGLMAIPAPQPQFQRAREPFARLRALLETLRAQGLSLDTLSMGMSDDLEAAIAEGATVVRIGSAVFGPRPKQK